MPDNISPIVMTGDQTTVAAVYESINLTVNGSIFSAIAVPPGTQLVITSVTVSSVGGPALWRIMYSIDGGGLNVPVFEVLDIDVAAAPAPFYGLNTGLAFNGNAGNVLISVEVLTPSGATPVTCTLAGYRIS